MKKVNELIDLVKHYSVPQIIGIINKLPYFEILLNLADGRLIKYVFEATGDIEKGEMILGFKHALIFANSQEYEQYIKDQEKNQVFPDSRLLSPDDNIS